jgi:hypothetical protein
MTVVLAARALHSPRLLQRYVQHNGVSIISASFEQIGRNYKRHLNSVVLPISAHPITDLLRKTVAYRPHQRSTLPYRSEASTFRYPATLSVAPNSSSSMIGLKPK